MKRIVAYIKGLLSSFHKTVCSHEFKLQDLELTNIPPLEEPEDRSDYHGWCDYLQKAYRHESETKRVKWPCIKCGEVFFAHCGLDILRHGECVSIESEG